MPANNLPIGPRQIGHKLGWVDRDISVHMPGGVIAIEIGDDYSIRMTGAVTKVSDGVIAREMFSTPLASDQSGHAGADPASLVR